MAAATRAPTEIRNLLLDIEFCILIGCLVFDGPDDQVDDEGGERDPQQRQEPADRHRRDRQSDDRDLVQPPDSPARRGPAHGPIRASSRSALPPHSVAAHDHGEQADRDPEQQQPVEQSEQEAHVCANVPAASLAITE